jgi:hypothetical protein
VSQRWLIRTTSTGSGKGSPPGTPGGREPSVRPDLRLADLCQANLSEADLRLAILTQAYLRQADLRRAHLSSAALQRAILAGANLSGAHLLGASLSEANLSEANLRWADLRRANLSEANLSEANLSEANLRWADLPSANLSGAHLLGASLSEANLIDAKLDHADLTGAKLWETQRAGWSIKDIICARAFWDREGEKLTEYGEGEFERLFAEKPRIVLHYPGGISNVELFALPLIVQRLEAEHPGSALRIRSVQDGASGALVTIVVEDLAGRDAEAFEQERLRLQTELKCTAGERDRLQQLSKWIFSEALSKMEELQALPRQVVNVQNPSAPMAIEGPMSRDTYNISGQAGAVGPGAQAHDNVFQQIQGAIDLPKLAEELRRLRNAMKGETTGTGEQDKAIGTIAAAEEAATKGDGQAALQYLKSAGGWTLKVAEKIGVSIATEALKKAMWPG